MGSRQTELHRPINLHQPSNLSSLFKTPRPLPFATLGRVPLPTAQPPPPPRRSHPLPPPSA
jgi:hypothetical protein